MSAKAKVSVALAAVLAATPIMSTAAHGDGQTNDFNDSQPDNSTMNIIKWTSFSSNGSTAYDFGVQQLQRTALTIVNNHDGDIRAEENYNNTSHAGDYGWESCTSFNIYLLCDYAHSHINDYNLNGLPVGDWKSTQCHEVGHATGVGERNTSGYWDDPANDSCLDDYDYYNRNVVVFPLPYDDGDITDFNYFS
jgi:hypothetical protein